MVVLAKRRDGVSILDTKKDIQVNVMDAGKYIRLTFVSNMYPHTLENKWDSMSIDIERSENFTLCHPFDTFFKSAMAIIEKNKNLYTDEDTFGTHPIYQTHYWHSERIAYPSDRKDHRSASMVGISRCEEYGYVLSFLKGEREKLRSQKDTEIFIQKENGKYSELASLYMQLFTDLRKLAETPYQPCMKESRQMKTVTGYQKVHKL